MPSSYDPPHWHQEDVDFRVARLQHDVHSLNGANEAHVAVHDGIRFENVYFATLTCLEPS